MEYQGGKNLSGQIRDSLQDFPGQFDLKGIEEQIRERYPEAKSVDDVPSLVYWAIVETHRSSTNAG